MRSMRGQFILNSSVTVDTFLVMTGVLTAYVLLKQFRNGLKFKNIPGILLHRYIRFVFREAENRINYFIHFCQFYNFLHSIKYF